MKSLLVIENINDLNQHFMPFKITFTKYSHRCHRLSIIVNLEISSTWDLCETPPSTTSSRPSCYMLKFSLWVSNKHLHKIAQKIVHENRLFTCLCTDLFPILWSFETESIHQGKTVLLDTRVWTSN